MTLYFLLHWLVAKDWPIVVNEMNAIKKNVLFNLILLIFIVVCSLVNYTFNILQKKIGICMKKLFWVIIIAGMMNYPAQAAKKDNFVSTLKKNKCMWCHTISIYGVKPGEIDEDEEYPEEIKASQDLMDLSKLSKNFSSTKKGSSKYLSEFLQGKIKIKGKKHSGKFEGDDKELSEIVKTLLKLSKDKK